MNWYRMFYVQTSTLRPRMHQKLTNHGKFCMQNNQLPTKSHVELKDNSIIHACYISVASIAFHVLLSKAYVLRTFWRWELSQPLKVHTIHQYGGTFSQVLGLFFPVWSLTYLRVLPTLAFTNSLPLKSATWQIYIAWDQTKSHVDITSNHKSQKMNQEAPSMGFTSNVIK